MTDQAQINPSSSQSNRQVKAELDMVFDAAEQELQDLLAQAQRLAAQVQQDQQASHDE